MFKSQDIILAVDYHETNTVIRVFNGRTGEENVLKIPTSRSGLHKVAADALEFADDDQAVWWVMESMTGWVRVQMAMPDRVRFVAANVLALPRPPKAKRKKTDKIDTKRLLRECLHNTLPAAYCAAKDIRQLRRLTGYREKLISQRTGLRNWIDRFLAHETWRSRNRLWAKEGMAKLSAFAATLGGSDQLVVSCKLEELEQLEVRLKLVVKEIERISANSITTRRLDAIFGIGQISAVSIAARIGDIGRFADAGALIGYAGLAPGVHRSDQTSWSMHLGGPGTDARLRHYLVEASVWARQIPRYVKTYERVERRRGKKVGRLVVTRLLLRSIFKMLRDGVEFVPTQAV